jgi:hypothetical protein
MSLHHNYKTNAQVPKKGLVFNKIFRWESAGPQTTPATSVAVVGSFTDWKPVPLKKDQTGDLWQLALNNIPGNRTHRYMLLVNGQPVNDPNADGLAIPETEPEKSWALTTARGPRLFMLFSQTK